MLQGLSKIISTVMALGKNASNIFLNFLQLLQWVGVSVELILVFLLIQFARQIEHPQPETCIPHEPELSN